MSNERIDENYLIARTAMQEALQEIRDMGVDINTSSFKAIFKGSTLKLYERILDDPETYKI